MSRPTFCHGSRELVATTPRLSYISVGHHPEESKHGNLAESNPGDTILHHVFNNLCERLENGDEEVRNILEFCSLVDRSAPVGDDGVPDRHAHLAEKPVPS